MLDFLNTLLFGFDWVFIDILRVSDVFEPIFFEKKTVLTLNCSLNETSERDSMKYVSSTPNC